MNRVQLVQVVIIATAAILGYQMFFSFGLFLTSAISSFLGRGEMAGSLAVSYGFMALLYAISMFLLFNNAPKLSGWVAEKIHLDENIRIGFTDTSVLYGVMLFLTLGSLLKNIPVVIYQLFGFFLQNAGGISSSGYGRNSYDQPNYSLWIETVMAIVLLFNIRPIVTYLQSKINPEDPHAIETEEEPEPINS